MQPEDLRKNYFDAFGFIHYSAVIRVTSCKLFLNHNFLRSQLQYWQLKHMLSLLFTTNNQHPFIRWCRSMWVEENL